ncbi:hypothetical protein [Proteus mirabilis]|uniref:hypothetical protein n=1 Tax=Proteus mirabilis TaxID=584 RepID=UPI003CFCEF58
MSTHVLANAVKTDTLLLLATGVYSQYSRVVTWEGVVASMQRMMEKVSMNNFRLSWSVDCQHCPYLVCRNICH